MARTIRLIDVTLRDAHQCLWATRMTTAMMRDLAPRLDRAGFEAIDLVGGAVFDVCVRYLRENPWERMRLAVVMGEGHAAHHPHARTEPLHLRVLRRRRGRAGGRALRCQRHALPHALRCAQRHAQPRDPDQGGQAPRPLRGRRARLSRTVPCTPTLLRAQGQGAASRSVSMPCSSRTRAGCWSPERVATLVPAAEEGAGQPAAADPHALQLRPCALRGPAGRRARRGRRAHRHLDARQRRVALRRPSASPPTLRRRGHEVRIDLAPVREVAERLAYIAEKEGKPVGTPNEYDEFHYLHQCPGGMVSNLAYQLETHGPRGPARGDPRGGLARARGPGLPDRGEPVRAVHRHAGRAQRDGARPGASALRHGAGRGAPLCARRLRRDRRTDRPQPLRQDHARRRAHHGATGCAGSAGARRASARRAGPSPPTTICCLRPSTTTRSIAP